MTALRSEQGVDPQGILPGSSESIPESNAAGQAPDWVRAAIGASGDILYRWDILSDHLTWAGEVEEVDYDHLILAPGSISRFLPVPGLTEHAVGFKSLADAIYLRNHVIETLEMANATEDRALRDELLTYVFVGGGYAGLEALAELQDFAAHAMNHYPRARLHGMRWPPPRTMVTPVTAPASSSSNSSTSAPPWGSAVAKLPSLCAASSAMPP